jgi:rfaE bifunctional protein kinase chain/domain
MSSRLTSDRLAVSLNQIKELISTRGKVSFVSGKFNVVHPGHLRLFRFAKEMSDFLVVGVYPDGVASDVLFPEEERLQGVQSNNWVDQAFVLSGGTASAISYLEPDFVVKGKEHENLDNPEQAAVEEYGGTLRFTSGQVFFSDSVLLQAENNPNFQIVQHADKFLSRRGISLDQVATYTKRIGNVRSVVIGDLIVDEYVDCKPLGMSAEDPTIVATPIQQKRFTGGAGIVALHAASLGGATRFLSVRGDDEIGQEIERTLARGGVNANILVDPSRPTTKKTRYRVDGKTLLRINELRDHQIDEKLSKEIEKGAIASLDNVDLLIFSDYSYGLVTPALVNHLGEVGNKKGVVLSADSQSSSQIGDISLFKNFSLLTPTEREVRLAVRDKDGGLVKIAQQLKVITNAQHVVVTLGAEGLFLHTQNLESDQWEDDRISALNVNPKDVAGAGDAFLVGTSLALAAGADIWIASYIGSLAAACQVNRVGNVPVTQDEILSKLKI